MRFLMMVMLQNNEDNADWAPTADEVAAMTKYNEELTQAGVLLALDGLHPTSKGARVSFGAGGKSTVADGPFTEAKEVVGGYALVEVASKEEAMKLAQQFMELHRLHWPDFECECEVRPVDGS